MLKVVIAAVGLAICVGAAQAGGQAAAGGQAGAGGEAGAGATAGQQAPARVRQAVVVVSIAPLKGLVEPLLPAGTTVEMIIPPGVSEHGYEVPPSKLALLLKADLVVLAGLGLEPQFEKFLAANPIPAERRSVVRLAEVAGIKATAEHDHDDHEDDNKGHAGHDHAHGGGGADPHVWLDPVAAMKLVPAVASALRAIGPQIGQPKEDLDHREGLLIAKLQRLDSMYKASIATSQRKKIVVAHDAYGHLARRYGFETIAIAGLTAAEPSPGAIAQAVKTIKAEKIPVVFVEPQLSPAAAKRVAERAGVKTRVLDPLGTGDYFKFMESNLDALMEGLGGTKVDPSGANVPAPGAQPAKPSLPSAAPTGR